MASTTLESPTLTSLTRALRSPTRVLWAVQTGLHTAVADVRRLKNGVELRVISDGEVAATFRFDNETELVNFAEDLHAWLLES